MENLLIQSENGEVFEAIFDDVKREVSFIEHENSRSAGKASFSDLISLRNTILSYASGPGLLPGDYCVIGPDSDLAYLLRAKSVRTGLPVSFRYRSLYIGRHSQRDEIEGFNEKALLLRELTVLEYLERSQHRAQRIADVGSFKVILAPHGRLTIGCKQFEALTILELLCNFF